MLSKRHVGSGNETGWDGALRISVVSCDSRGGRALSSFILFVFPRKIVIRSLVLEKEILVHCNIFMSIFPLTWSIIKPSGEIKLGKLHMHEKSVQAMKSWGGGGGGRR